MRLRQRPACPLPASLLAGAALPSWKVSPRLAPSGCTGDVYSNILYLSTHTLTNSIFVHFCWKANLLKIYPLHPDTQTLQTFVHILFIGRNIYSIYSKLSTHSNKLLLCLWYRSTLLLNLKFEAISFDKCQVGCSAVVQRHDVYFIYAADQSLGTSFFLLQARHETHLSLHKYRIWKLFLVHECCWSRTINAFIAPHWTIEHCLFGTLLSDKALESRYKPLLEEN